MTAPRAQSHFTYSISLGAANVRPLPATPSLATGKADIVLDTFPAFTTIGWTVRWTNLTALPASASLHGVAAGGDIAPVFFPLGNFFSDSTPASGAYSGFRQISDPVQIAAIRDGLAYISLGTAAYPDGEIRGQLFAVPEPSIFAVTAGGLLLMQVSASRLKRRGLFQFRHRVRIASRSSVDYSLLPKREDHVDCCSN